MVYLNSISLKTLNTVLSRAPKLKEVILEGSVRKQGEESEKSLTLACENIRLLVLIDLSEEMEEIEVKTNTNREKVMVVKDENIKVNITSLA